MREILLAFDYGYKILSKHIEKLIMNVCLADVLIT